MQQNTVIPWRLAPDSLRVPIMILLLSISFYLCKAQSGNAGSELMVWQTKPAVKRIVDSLVSASPSDDKQFQGYGYWLLTAESKGETPQFTLAYRLHYYYPDEPVPGCKIYYTGGKLVVVQEKCHLPQFALSGQMKDSLSAVINRELAPGPTVPVTTDDGKVYSKNPENYFYRGLYYRIKSIGSGWQATKMSSTY